MPTRKPSESPAARRRQRLSRIAAGRCTSCSRPILQGHTLCEWHLQKYKDRYKRKREVGECSKCKEPVVPGLTTCKFHREKAKESSKIRREQYKLDRRCICCAAYLDDDADGEHVSCCNCRENLNHSV